MRVNQGHMFQSSHRSQARRLPAFLSACLEFIRWSISSVGLENNIYEKLGKVTAGKDLATCWYAGSRVMGSLEYDLLPLDATYLFDHYSP